MLKGFRSSSSAGNVIDLAVAVVIGAAFTAVVNSIVENVINPLIGALFRADNLNDALVVVIPTLGRPRSSSSARCSARSSRSSSWPRSSTSSSCCR